MSATSYPVPKPLWDALENVLTVKSRELIKDIAKTLHQSEKPLLDAFKANKHKFHLVDMNDPTDNKYMCEYIDCQHAVAHRCRKPVLLGQTRCPEHSCSKMPSIETKPILRRMTTDTGDMYFVDNEMNVFNIAFEWVGTYKDDSLVLFEIEEEEEYVEEE